MLLHTGERIFSSNSLAGGSRGFASAGRHVLAASCSSLTPVTSIQSLSSLLYLQQFHLSRLFVTIQPHRRSSQTQAQHGVQSSCRCQSANDQTLKSTKKVETDDKQLDLTTMKIFLTGGSGFVGGQLIAYLTRCMGDSVVALSRSPSADDKIKKARALIPTKGWPTNGTRPQPGTVDIVRGDLTKQDDLIKGMRGCDAVIHAAAKIDGWGPYAAFHEVTVVGTQNTLAAAKAAGVPKFVFVSSEAVLVKADGSIGSVDESTPVAPPLWAPYSRSKAEAERLVLEANSPPDFETVVIRPRFVWGRGDSVLRPSLTQQFNNGSYRFITPSPVSSTSHVINVCHALRLAAQAKGRGGQVYFVTDGPPHSLNDFLMEYIASQPGVKRPTATMPFWLLWARETALESLPFLGYGVTREPLLGRQDLALSGRDVRIDISKIQRELGYQPVVTVEEGIQDANA